MSNRNNVKWEKTSNDKMSNGWCDLLLWGMIVHQYVKYQCSHFVVIKKQKYLYIFFFPIFYSTFCTIRRSFIRHFVPFGVFPFNILYHSVFFAFDVLYHSAFCPIQRFFHSTFCTIRRFFHSTFCPIQRFVFRRFVIRRFVLSAFITSTFCQWTNRNRVGIPQFFLMCLLKF